MRRAHSLLAVLCLGALLAGCGGDGVTTPSDPHTTTLNLDFGYITVEDDCDGIEGDGEFEFRVETYESPTETPEVLLHQSVTLGPGGRSTLIGHRSYTVPDSGDARRTVVFHASEFDKNIFGTTYRDERLNFASGSLTYFHTNGTWNTLGDHAITLGADGCRVTLRWRASVEST